MKTTSNTKPTFHPDMRSVTSHEGNFDVLPGFHYVDTLLIGNSDASYDITCDAVNRNNINKLEQTLADINAIIISRDIYPVDQMTMRYRVLYAIGQHDAVR